MKLIFEIAIGVALGGLALDAIHLIEARYTLEHLQLGNPQTSTRPMQLPALPPTGSHVIQGYTVPPTHLPPIPQHADYVINETTGRRIDLPPK